MVANGCKYKTFFFVKSFKLIFLFGKNVLYLSLYLVSVADHNIKMNDLRTGCDTGCSM